MTTSDTIETYLVQLGADRGADRHLAVQHLVESGEPAIAPLVQLVTQPLPPLSSGYRTNARLKQNMALETLRQIGQPAVDTLINAMAGQKSMVKERLFPLIIELGGDEDKDSLHRLLRAEFASARRIRKQKALLYAILLLAILLAHSCAHGIYKFLGASLQFVLQLFSIIAMLKGTIGIQKASLLAFAKTNRTEWAGLCALCLADVDGEVRKTAGEVLTNILPGLKAGDKALFTTAEMELLIKAMNRKKPALTLAILKALEQIGDERALPRVEALAAELTTRRDSRSQEIYQAAEDCLPFLRQRAEQSRQANTLLRASHPSDEETVAILLRPVQNVGSTPNEELLRPTH